ncbi:RodZ domain-containing protein [Nocardioides sp. CPCC 205120]|uniref:helix-turn-helix domain-containing protein n=1 Tax=Nocardioides sp. CPCC 205120 TaxID=3406462 RepID=UPI003B5030B8
MSTHHARTTNGPDRADHDAHASAARRDPFGLGLPRRPDWEALGVVHEAVEPGAGEELAPGQVVEIRRSGLVSGAIGVVAAGLAVAWLSRAAADGGVVTWVVTALLALVAIAHLSSFVDARVPLAVVDEHGVRMRLGRTWQGLPWESVDHVVHVPRAGLLRDGSVLVVPFETEAVLAGLDRRARWQAWLATRWYGGPFALPVGLSTRVVGTDDVATSLRDFADPEVPVLVQEPERPAPAAAPADEAVADDATPEPVAEPVAEPTPEPTAPVRVVEVVAPRVVEDVPDRPELAAAADRADDHAAAAAADEREKTTPDATPDARPRLRPWVAAVIARLGERRTARDAGRARSADDVDEQSHAASALDRPAVEPSAAPSPLREPRSAVRAEIHREVPERVLPEQDDHLRRPADDGLAAYDRAWEPLPPAVVAAEPEPEPEARREPVIGPVLADARRRLGLSVDQVADRTRIRPHVIEAVEVDDFAPCGGDFYARGHLRTLARVLGVEAAELVQRYDDEYADAPIDARRVFEAELATVPGGSLRATRGGPNWSVLVAAVMAVVLLWSVAQLLLDRGPEVDTATTGAAGLSAGSTVAPVPVVLTGAEAPAEVTVRDGDGEVVWQGRLAAGESRTVDAPPPVRISSSDGAVRAGLGDDEPSPLGQPGDAVQRTLAP